MKVLFLSQIVPYPPHGGVLQRGYHIVRELGQRAEVTLLAFVHPDVLPTEEALEESRRALGAYCATIEYFPLWAKGSRTNKAAALAMSALSPRPFSMIAHRSPAFQERVQGLLTANRFDVIHVDTLALARFLPPGLRIPTALTHHNIESVLMERRSTVEPHILARLFLKRDAAKLRRWEDRLAPRVGVNLMMSEQDKAILQARVPNARAEVVANGVDVNYFTPRPGDGRPPSLIYTGGMNMFANRDAVMHFLREIWPRIRSRHQDVRFFAVGQDPPSELSALAAADPRIVVTGYVADIRPHVAQAAVYVVPLRVGGGTRLKVLDAMASGKAIVSTSIGCEGLNVTPGKHLVTADMPEAFAEATLRLLGDPDERQALGAAARDQAVRCYSWEVIGEQLVGAYRVAVGEGAQRR